jgi:DNA end-binding protein Ku
MARPLWKGSLGFGLVTIPVSLYSAEDSSDLHFTLLDGRNLSRVRYQRVNEETGEEVPYSEIVKGYEYTDGNYVVVTDEDFKRAAVEQTRTVAIEDFVDRTDIDPVYFSTPYYILPEKNGEHAFEILRRALESTNKVGIAKVVIRTRQHLAAVLPHKGILLLHVLRFNQELREVPALPATKSRVGEKELEMAQRLIDAMVGEWKPEKYHDEYHDALLKWIRAKAERGGKPPPTEPEPDDTAPPTYNIMELLKQSLSGRGKPAAAETAQAPRAKPAASRTRKTKKAASTTSSRRRKAG